MDKKTTNWDVIFKGIELYWTTWGKMRGEKAVLGDIGYLKAENGKGFERIFSVNIEENQEFLVQQMVSSIEAGLLPGSILIIPNTKPANLAEMLFSKGFTISDNGPCMMLYLDDYEAKKSEPFDFEIIKIMEKSQLKDWLNILNTALFGCELITCEQLSDLLPLNNILFYLGLVEGKPVTACMTLTENDTSVLELVATLKEYRQKGYASALINKAIIDLRDKGIKTVSLHSEPDTAGVYAKLGFKECFRQIIAVYNMKRE